jgi:hypothetical protein
VNLYIESQKRANECAERIALDPEQRVALDRQVWLLSGIAFRPGDSLRGGFDRLVKANERAARGWTHPPTEMEVQAVRLRLLAAYFVAHALGATGD